MRILIINCVCGIKSTGRIVTDLAERYISNGHQCFIAYGREKVPDKYKSISYRIGNDYKFYKNALKARFLDNEGFNARKETLTFIKWADKYNPDILWLHNLHGYYINVQILFDWIKKRPNMTVKWTLHDCWAFTGHCAHFSYIKCEKWKDDCNKCVQRGEYPKSLFFSNSKNNFISKKNCFTNVKNMTLITPSYWLTNLVKNSFLSEYEIITMHNTIDTDIFYPRKSDFRVKHNLEDKFIILGVASAWNEKKGFNDFVKLSKMLDSSYKIVLVGLTDKQIKQLPKNILGIEKTNSKLELAEIYSMADVFLNLTYEDTYPTVNLEAISCGTQCITYNTGGSVESVSPENVIEQGDIFAVMYKMKELKEDNK